MQRTATASVAALAAPVLGLAGGIAVVMTHPGHASQLWLVWAPLAVALSTSAAAVLVYGLRRWTELAALHPVRVRDVAVPVAAIATIGVLAINVTRVLPERDHANATWHNGLLVSLVVLASAPAWGVMYGVRHVASTWPVPNTPGERVVLLLALRRLLQRLLAAGGTLVALVTFQFGALMMLEKSTHLPLGDLPPQYTLVFGGVGSLLVALAYVPAWAALQRRGQELCEHLFPIEDLNDAQTILSRVSDSQEMEQILGANRSVLADLQNGLAILAPLLAGAAATLLPH